MRVRACVPRACFLRARACMCVRACARARALGLVLMAFLGFRVQGSNPVAPNFDPVAAGRETVRGRRPKQTKKFSGGYCAAVAETGYVRARKRHR